MIVLCWRITWFTAMLLKRCFGKNLSFFKASKTLMGDIPRLKQVFIDKIIPPATYLADFLKLSSKKHLLEYKKGKIVDFKARLFLIELINWYVKNL